MAISTNKEQLEKDKFVDDGSGNVAIRAVLVGGASGDVVGPASAVDNNLAAFDSTTGKLIKDSGLPTSVAGTKAVQTVAFDFTTDTATGDGAAYFVVPPSMNGMDLVTVGATVITAGTTGTTNIQIANVTQSADMLSTVITIDSAETDSSTAATPAVIDTGNDDVASFDVIRIDVDAVSTTAAKGLIVRLEFRLP